METEKRKIPEQDADDLIKSIDAGTHRMLLIIGAVGVVLSIATIGIRCANDNKHTITQPTNRTEVNLPESTYQIVIMPDPIQTAARPSVLVSNLTIG